MDSLNSNNKKTLEYSSEDHVNKKFKRVKKLFSLMFFIKKKLDFYSF